jgi:ABC-2 type transport system permease protein
MSGGTVRARGWLESWPRIVGQAARVGFSEYSSIMSLRIWLSGMLLRVVAQVSFFALIGRLLGSQAEVAYLLVGNAVSLAAMFSLVTIATIVWERRQGTLPLVVSSPTFPGLVFVGRSLHWIAEGWVSALAALLVTAFAFRLRLPLAGVLWTLPLLPLISASSYALGCFLAALVLRVMDLRNVVSNLAYYAMVGLCGVIVPVSRLPGPLRPLAEALPLTHGLAAVRAVLDGRSIGAALPEAAVELAVGAAWLLIAFAAFAIFTEGARRNGSIELST